MALVGSERLQLARRYPGESRTDTGVAALSGGRAVNVEDGLSLCIDEFPRFDRLDTVVRAVAVVFAGGRAFVVGGINSGAW